MLATRVEVVLVVGGDVTTGSRYQAVNPRAAPGSDLLLPGACRRVAGAAR